MYLNYLPGALCCVLSIRFLWTDTGLKHSATKTQTVWWQQGGDGSGGGSALPWSSRQIWPLGTDPVLDWSDWLLLLGGQVGGLGWHRRDLQRDPKEREWCGVQAWRERSVLGSRLFQWWFHHLSQKQWDICTSSSFLVQQSGGVPGLARGHPLLLQHLLWRTGPPPHHQHHLHWTRLCCV